MNRIRSASSNKNKPGKADADGDESGQAAWEAAARKTRANRAPSHPAALRSANAATGANMQNNRQS